VVTGPTEDQVTFLIRQLERAQGEADYWKKAYLAEKNPGLSFVPEVQQEDDKEPTQFGGRPSLMSLRAAAEMKSKDEFNKLSKDQQDNITHRRKKDR